VSSAKPVIVGIFGVAALTGAAIYYLQVYAYYYEVTPDPGRDVMLVAKATGASEPIAYSDFRAIDADSSPIRYRACFSTPETPSTLAPTHVVLAGAQPRIAPGWFGCFDAGALSAALEGGTATAFLGTRNIAYGIDRIVAITDDGRGYVWHEVNECGRKSYDGTVDTEDCPPPTANGE